MGKSLHKELYRQLQKKSYVKNVFNIKFVSQHIQHTLANPANVQWIMIIHKKSVLTIYIQQRPIEKRDPLIFLRVGNCLHVIFSYFYFCEYIFKQYKIIKIDFLSQRLEFVVVVWDILKCLLLKLSY